MPVDPQLLEQALSLPEDKDPEDSPIVTAVILGDPANAADLVPYLDRPGSLQALNARRILVEFDAPAAPAIVHALRSAGPAARMEGIEVVWSILLAEEPRERRDGLLALDTADLDELLNDKHLLPEDDLPDYIERDFTCRICDLALIMLESLHDPEYDPSHFRLLDDDEREAQINDFRRRRFSGYVA